jgi:hypothetical protein
VESLKRRISLDGALKERSVQMKNRLVFILAVAVMTAISARAAPTYTYGFSPVQTTLLRVVMLLKVIMLSIKVDCLLLLKT